jgi:hypothetical protein
MRLKIKAEMHPDASHTAGVSNIDLTGRNRFHGGVPTASLNE